MIRSATTDDDIVSIAVASGIPGLNEQRAIEIVDEAVDGGGCLVHTDERDAVTGFAIIYRRAFFGRDFVKLLAVAHDARRNGVAVALLRQVCAQAVTDTVFISTNQSNDAMRALLRNEHWTFSGRLNGVDDCDPELVFWKRSG